MDFKGKKVTVMGLGLYENGSGIAATRFLVAAGAKVTVTDLKTAAQLAPQIKRLGALRRKIKLVLGEHREADFKNADLILKNPGVPSTSKFLAIARENGVPIETDISLFFQLIARKRIIGITGTRGKSTTTTLIYDILRATDKRAVLGGNITSSPLAQMPAVKRGGPVVLELSSWMLESLEPKKMSPYISVFTNVYPDHLNTYAGIKEYAAAKENIFRWQNAQDICVLNRDNKFTREMGGRVPAQRFRFSLKYFAEENGAFVRAGWIYFRRDGQEEKILAVKNLKVLGEHNRQNDLAAVAAAMAYGVPAGLVKKVAENFRGVPDRLELLREVKGVKYYNDTTSTTPEATIAALRALHSFCPTCRRGGDCRTVGGVGGSLKNIILIAGGADKGLDFKVLAKEIKKYCRAVILLKGTGTDRLKLKIKNYELRITECGSMADAVGVAQSLARKGEIVLLSPACASFGMFVNEFDRGAQFRKAVGSLK